MAANGDQKKKPPEKEIRVGEVTAAVFVNTRTSDGREFRSVKLHRRYKDGDDWKSSSSFTGEGQINAAIAALQQARDYIATRQPTGVK